MKLASIDLIAIEAKYRMSIKLSQPVSLTYSKWPMFISYEQAAEVQNAKAMAFAITVVKIFWNILRHWLYKKNKKARTILVVFLKGMHEMFQSAMLQ